MSAEQLAAILGSILSIAFQVIPGLKAWFDGLNADLKRLVIVGLLLVTAAGYYGLACLGLVGGVECTSAGAWAMFEFWAIAAVSNQVTYLLTKKHE